MNIKEEVQDKIAKCILKLTKHDNMVVDFKPSADDIIFTLRKELNGQNKMSVFIHNHYTDSVYFPCSMYKADINCENIKEVLRRATEIMFGAINA